MCLDTNQWHLSGEYISFNGIKLFVRSEGIGQPVVCLHAFPTGSYDYSRITPHLTKQYKLYFLDYPGFGFSDKPKNFPYSLFSYSDAVEEVISYFDLKRIYIISHDIGDSVTLELLRRGTVKIDKLIMLNGSVYSIPFDDPIMWLSQRLWISKIFGPIISELRLFRKVFFKRMMDRIFAQILSQNEINAFWSLLQYNDGLSIYHQLMQYMPERWKYQLVWLDTLKKSELEATLIWGQADPVATPAVADFVCGIRKGINYIKLEKVGHYPHWEKPELVANIVQDVFR